MLTFAAAACNLEPAPHPGPTGSAITAPPRDAAAPPSPPISDAACVHTPAQVTAPEPPVATCAPPTPQVMAALERQILVGLRARRAACTPDAPCPPELAIPPTVRAVCAERNAWLVEATLSPTAAHLVDAYSRAETPVKTVWLVPMHGQPALLPDWTLGPIYDFDGDGTVEASTLSDGELKIWFAGGARPAFFAGSSSVPLRWASWSGHIVGIADGVADREPMHAFAFSPGEPSREEPAALAALVTPARSIGCPPAPPPPPPAPTARVLSPADAKLAAAIAQVLDARGAPARCVELDAAAKRMQEHAIAALIMRDNEPDTVTEPTFEWGCTSHGETPVTVGYLLPHDRAGSDVWAVQADKPTRLESVSSAAPDEWATRSERHLGEHADFDGDGDAESVIVRTYWYHATWIAPYVRIAGRSVELPSTTTLRLADGARDGSLAFTPLAPITGRPRPCPETTGDADCDNQPPAGYRKDSDIHVGWDWEQHAPQISVLGAHDDRFVRLPTAKVAAIVTATAATRATVTKLSPPAAPQPASAPSRR